MRFYPIFTLLLMISQSVFAQSRYQFAHSYFGIENSYTTDLKTTSYSAINSRILIGGSHFWNKADFFVSFPLATIDWDKSINYTEGVITGGRYMPFGLSKSFPSPYVGVNWSVPTFGKKDGPRVVWSDLGWEAGFSFMLKGSIAVETNVRYLHNQSVEYYTSRSQIETIDLPRFTIGLSLKRYFDFTSYLDSDAAIKHVLRVDTALSRIPGRGGLSLAAGFSSSLARVNSLSSEKYPFLTSRKMMGLGPDISVGYYSRKADLFARLTYRTFKLSSKGYEASIENRYHHAGVEVAKFLFDYKGFVPFAGLGVDHIFMTQTLRDGAHLDRLKKTRYTYSLVLGWDIRPTQVDWFILRTNVRLIPRAPQSMKLDQLEINFIQFVFYPARYKIHLKKT